MYKGGDGLSECFRRRDGGVGGGGGVIVLPPREKFKLQNLVEKLKEATYIATSLTEKTCHNFPGKVIIPPPLLNNPPLHYILHT